MDSPGLKQKDNTSKSIPRHKMKSAVDDEYETPDELYYSLTSHYDIVCELDVFANEWYENEVMKTNSKCLDYFTIEDNALEVEWLLPDGKKPTGIWWNDPSTLHKECLVKSEQQWLRHDLDILGMLPANTVRPPYFYNHVQRYNNKGLIIEPLINWNNPTVDGGYINFKKRGKDTEFSSRNGYIIIRYFSKDSWTNYLKKWRLESKRYGDLPTY